MRGVRLCLIPLVLVLLQGCSGRMWYDGMKQGQTFECSKLQDKERENCRQDAGVSYDHYQLERQEVLKKDQD